MTEPAIFDLETRTGWPDELRLFLDRFPRADWPPRAEIGAVAKFWLDIHDGFRGFAGKLTAATVEFREQRVTPTHFRSWFAPRLDMFLSHLNGHHQIEDYEYFPLFVTAESRLKRGFDILENDHAVIHAAMDRLVETANGFLAVAPDDGDRLRYAGDAYAQASDRLMTMLGRHLDDEEDLIVPVILARGERDLGL
jgi:hypothetical protein